MQHQFSTIMVFSGAHRRLQVPNHTNRGDTHNFIFDFGCL